MNVDWRNSQGITKVGVVLLVKHYRYCEVPERRIANLVGLSVPEVASIEGAKKLSFDQIERINKYGTL